MRLILVAIVLLCGGIMGLRAIEAVSQLQDAKLERFCKQIPVGASYDEVCADYR
jgi:uncharacterized protein with ACT and thioredoxin-like domain